MLNSKTDQNKTLVSIERRDTRFYTFVFGDIRILNKEKNTLKRKFSKILGVGLTLALLTSLLLTAAPVSALSQPIVTPVTAADSVISTVDADWNIRFELAKQLTGGTRVGPNTTDPYNLAGIGDSIIFTATAAGTVTFTMTNGTVTAAVSGGGSWTSPTITFTASGETATVTVLTVGAANGLCNGTWASTSSPTAAVGVGAADTITIVFPSGTAVTTTPTATILAGPGWINGLWLSATTPTLTSVVGTVLTRTVVITLPTTTRIGEGAEVRLSFTGGITNPATPGSYTLTVATSQELAVTSAAYTIIAPIVLPDPGTVTVYNAAGILMSSWTGPGNLANAIGAALAGFTIKVEPGSYDETIDIDKALTFVSTGSALDTIIADIDSSGVGGQVTISGDGTALIPGVVFDGFTVKGLLAGGNALIITGDKATVQNCTFTKSGLATTTVAQTMVFYNNAGALGGTISNCTFDTTLGAIDDTGIDVDTNGLTISGCSFLVDSTVAGVNDIAIDNAGGTTLLPTAISSGIFAGGSGSGVKITAGVASVTTSSFSALNMALDIDGGVITVKDSTITNCGIAVSTTLPLGVAAIDIATGASTPSIYNNTISSSPAYAVNVAAGAVPANINIMFNQITGNTLNVYTAVVGTVNATHNWWGAATGPAAGTIVGATAATMLVNTTGYLGASATGAFIAGTTAVSLITKTTVGVDVTAITAPGVAWIPVAADMIGVANYAENPQAATPLPAVAGGFYDVYLVDNPAAPQLNIAGAQVLIKFYNANVTANTEVYVWSTLQGNWVKCVPTVAGAAATQGVNTFSGFCWVSATITTIPAITDLAGTPFALVDAEAVAPVAIAAPTVIALAQAATDVSLTPTFIWETVAGATAYELQVATYPNFAGLVIDKTLDSGALLEVPFFASDVDLDYSTTYYWRVRAVSVQDWVSEYIDQGAWVTRVFTTIAEPEAVVYTCPQCGLTFDAEAALETHVTEAHPPAAPAVTPGYIWVIIAVGAVLALAVIILIVRTRRVA